MSESNQEDFIFDQEDLEEAVEKNKRSQNIPRSNQQRQEGSVSSRNTQKRKMIKKIQTMSSKISSLSKRHSKQVKMGRPSNKEVEKEHILESRSYNDIVYHFARLMIFLKLKQGLQTGSHNLKLSYSELSWIERVEKIMDLQNFPDFNQEKKPTFLLHPNSLHFVFDYLKQHENRFIYSQEELKCMFLTLLKKRKLFSTSVYDNINAYWSDILYLVNNPVNTGEIEISQQSREIDDIVDEDSEEQMSPDPQRKENQNFKERRLNAKKQKQNQQKGSKMSDKKKRNISQFQSLKRQLAEDDSIVAHEVACYLYACRLKFQIRIKNDQ